MMRAIKEIAVMLAITIGTITMLAWVIWEAGTG